MLGQSSPICCWAEFNRRDKLKYQFVCLIVIGFFMATSPIKAADITALELEVSNVEKAFAKSMADRDFMAFKSFIDDEAIFWGAGPLRGKQAVWDAWQGYFEGDDAPFAWKPETVLVLESGKLALSTGPVWIAGGTVTAYYHSTWRKNDDGQWKIIFDKGQRYCPPPKK